MSRFSFGLAEEADDMSLRDILRVTPMNGSIRIIFLREPNVFQSIGILGRLSQVIVAREKDSSNIAGFGIRTIREAFVNGGAQQIGYLSSLRSLERFRGSPLLARGYRYLKYLHQDRKTPLYLTTIIDGNSLALRNLIGGRAGLPQYRFMGEYLTFALDIRKNFGGSRTSGLEIVKGSNENIHEIIGFVNESNVRKQFAPFYRPEEIVAGAPFYRGLKLEDFYVGYIGSSIVGVVAKWDQCSFKQTVVSGYGMPLSLLRPVLNTASYIVKRPSLPKAGEEIRSFYAGFMAIKDDSKDILSALLQRICDDNRDNGYACALFGLHSQDRLAKAFKGRTCIKYLSRLYAVHWEDGEHFFHALDGRTPFLELATL